MKKTFVFLVFMLSLSAEAFVTSIPSVDSDSDRKQRCLENQNREQREYSECLENCRQQEATDRQTASLTGMGSYVSSCYCSQPISLGCY